MYYALIMLSVVMFGGCFALKDLYRKYKGSTIKVSLQFSLIGAIAGYIVLLITSGFKFEYTPFTLLMASLSAINGYAFTFCSFKALDKINLSLYSLFSMLGGMVLPFVQGILFYGEKLTVAKAVCFVFITVALLMTVEKGEKKNGALYYALIFILNGMSGVITTIFAQTDLPKASATGYTNLTSICAIVISAVLLLTVFRKKEEADKFSLKATAVGAASGIASKLANLILVLALAHVDGSVQYPMVTGGVMIVSTLICFFGPKKPTKKEILSIAVAFVGLLLLFAIPV